MSTSGKAQSMKRPVGSGRTTLAIAGHRSGRIDTSSPVIGNAFTRTIDGLVVAWPAGMTNRYGFTRRQAIGRLSHELLKTIFPPAIGDLQQFLHATPQWSGEVIHHHADGRALRVTSSWSLTGSGETVTECHIASPAIGSSDDLLRIANDLSQPLTAIGNYVGVMGRLLQRNDSDGQAMQRALMLANDEVARCARKLRLLRDLASNLRDG